MNDGVGGHSGDEGRERHVWGLDQWRDALGSVGLRLTWMRAISKKTRQLVFNQVKSASNAKRERWLQRVESRFAALAAPQILPPHGLLS